MRSTGANTRAVSGGGSGCSGGGGAGGGEDRRRLRPVTKPTTQGDTSGSSNINPVHAAKYSLGFILNLASPTVTATPKDAIKTAAPPAARMHLQEHPEATVTTPIRLPRQRSIAKAEPEIKSNTKPSAKAARSKGKVKGAKKPSGDAKPNATLSSDQKRLARKCTVEDCANYTINKGLCFRHGGGKKCTFEDCNASAKIAGLCWKHGGSIQCVADGCDRRGKSRGLCWAHGGGTKCHADACSKVAVSNGFCWAHGGGKRCQFDGCQRPAYERTLNYCPKHFKRFESGEAVLEL